MEEKRIFNALTLYRSRGLYLHKLEQFDNALTAYDEGYKNEPEDPKLLTYRALAYADAMKPQQALEDAKEAIRLDRSSIFAHSVVARALYTMTEFENATVKNFRGQRIRKQPPYFSDGINQGIATIEDCIGDKAGPVMLDFLPIIKNNDISKVEDSPVGPRCCKHVSRIPKQEVEYKMTRLERREHYLLNRKLAMKYLGPMANDKFFIENLLDDHRIPSANKAGSKEVSNIVQEALAYLTNQQDILRTQQPYYSVKFSEKAKSSYQTKLMKERLLNERTTNLENARHFVTQMKKFLGQRRIVDVVRIADRMQTFLNSKTPNTFPEGEMFTSILYTVVGDAYLLQYRLSYKLSDMSQQRRISFLMGIPCKGRPKSYDSVMANYPTKFVDLNDAVVKYELELKKCENPHRRCWLLYELSQMSNKLKNYTMAKFYSKRCQTAAQEIESHAWWLNACYALISGDMAQRNQTDVRAHVERGLEYTKKMKNSAEIQAFLKKCLQMSQESLPPTEHELIKEREQQVLSILDDQAKKETRVLLKRIWTVPERRRFIILPRKASYSATYKPERRRYDQTGLTVVPGREKPLREVPHSTIPGLQDFNY